MFRNAARRLPGRYGADVGRRARPRVIADLEAAGLEAADDRPGPTPLALADWPIDPDAVVAEWRFAAAATGRAVKQSLPGLTPSPGTDCRVGATPPDLSSGRSPGGTLGDSPANAALAGERLREVVAALAAAGCPLVEIEEPAADPDRGRQRGAGSLPRRPSAPDGRPRGFDPPVARRDGGKCTNTAGSATFFDLPYASYAFDLIAGPTTGGSSPRRRAIAGSSAVRWIPRPGGRTGRDPRLGGALLPPRPAVAVSNGLAWPMHQSLAGLDRESARAKLALVADAVRIASADTPDELSRLLDPRAVDIRSRLSAATRGHRTGVRLGAQAHSRPNPYAAKSHFLPPRSSEIGNEPVAQTIRGNSGPGGRRRRSVGRRRRGSLARVADRPGSGSRRIPPAAPELEQVVVVQISRHSLAQARTPRRRSGGSRGPP